MKNIFIQSRIYFAGIILVIISAILHFFAQFITNGTEFLMFCLNYLLTACYWVYIVLLLLYSNLSGKRRCVLGIGLVASQSYFGGIFAKLEQGRIAIDRFHPAMEFGF